MPWLYGGILCIKKVGAIFYNKWKRDGMTFYNFMFGLMKQNAVLS